MSHLRETFLSLSHAKNYTQTEIDMVTLEEIIPKNHLIRKIDKAIDLNIIHERVAHLYCPDKETVERILPLQNNSLYTTNFTEPLSYQASAFLKLPKFP